VKTRNPGSRKGETGGCQGKGKQVEKEETAKWGFIGIRQGRIAKGGGGVLRERDSI